MGPMHDPELRAELARVRLEALMAAGARIRIRDERPARRTFTVLRRIRRRRPAPALETYVAPCACPR